MLGSQRGTGQLGGGDGVGSSSSVPVAVAGLSGALSLTGADADTCALMPGGSVKCCGYGFYGSLGNGSTADHNTLVGVTGLTGASHLGGVATGIAAGVGQTCATLTDGDVRCWGDDAYGQLGTGNASRGIAALSELSGSAFSAISVGNLHVWWITTGGKAQCWGRAYNGGELGIGVVQAGTAYGLPQDVTGLSGGVSAIAAGTKIAARWRMARPSAGVTATTDSWATAHPAVTRPPPTPVTVSGLTGVTALTAGDDFTCAIAGGAAKCWGRNNKGQLGDNGRTDRSAPVQIYGLTSGVTSISAGHTQACAYQAAAWSTAGATTFPPTRV